MNIWKENRFLDHDQIFFDWEKSIDDRLNNKTHAEKARTKLLLMLAFLSYWGCIGYGNKKDYDYLENKINVDTNEENSLKVDDKAYNIEVEESECKTFEANKAKKEKFWWVELSFNWEYDVPWISKSAKKMKHKDFPKVKFWDCRLTRSLWSVVYSNALVATEWKPERRESHKETYYSQKQLRWSWLNIPWRHVAKDGTVRDWDWYIVVAAPLKVYPRWTRIMTTLGPGKVYDTWWMRWRWIDIYTNW